VSQPSRRNSNAGLGILGGRAIELYENLVVSSGILPDGRLNASNFTGILVWDFYATGSTNFANNLVRDNVSGFNQYFEENGTLNRNDFEYRLAGPSGLEPNPLNSTNPILGVTTLRNTSLTGTLTLQTETDEWNLWRNKLTLNTVVVGVRRFIQYQANTAIQAENYNEMSGVVNFGSGVGYIGSGDFLRFRNLNLGTGVRSFTANVVTTEAGSSIQIRSGSPTGTLLGTLNVLATGSFSTLQSQRVTLPALQSGVKDIYLVFTGAVNVDWFRFDTSSTPVSTARAINRSATTSVKSTDQVLASELSFIVPN